MTDKKDAKSAPAGGAGMSSADAKNWESRLRTEYEAPHKWNEAWGELFSRGIPGEYGARIEFLKDELSKQPKTEKTFQDGQAFPKFGTIEFRKQKCGYYDPLAEENQLPQDGTK
jgi:hypothetical protein